MKRLAILIALLAAIPGAASAQSERLPSKLTISPYTGVRVPFGGGLMSVYVPGGQFLAKQERTGSPLLGVEAKLLLRGPVSLIGGSAYSRSGEVQLFLSDSIFGQAPDWVAESDGAMWLNKLGLSARFESPVSITETRRRPTTDISVAAATVGELGKIHPALNLGFLGNVALSSGVDLMVGIEDYLVFWDESKVAPPMAGIVQLFRSEEVEGVELHYTTSNILQIRLGVSVRAW